jgi:hypothetical protein
MRFIAAPIIKRSVVTKHTARLDKLGHFYFACLIASESEAYDGAAFRVSEAQEQAFVDAH